MNQRPWESEVRAAVRGQDWAAATSIVARLVEHLHTDPAPVDGAAVREILRLLRGARRYDDLLGLADAVLVRGSADPAVTRAYAQALLDRGTPVSALRLLEALPQLGAGERAAEQAERAGGIGRAFKEMYLLDPTPGRQRHLEAAIAAYRGAYDQDTERIWHGVNLVALLARAAEEQLTVEDGSELLDPPAALARSRQLARALLDAVAGAPDPDAWTLAVAAEASVAIGDFEQADRWLDRFVAAPDTDAFRLASALRQLERVWRFTIDDQPGVRLLPRLRSALLQHAGGQISVSPGDLRDERIAGLEKVFGAERYNSLTWYRTGLERCRAVTRIEDAFGDGVGTGFLIDGRGLHTSLPECVVVTNAHVVPDSLPPESAFVTFRGLEPPRPPAGSALEAAGPGPGAATAPRYRVRTVLWTSPAGGSGLDASLLELDGWPEEVIPAPVAIRLAPRNTEPHPRAYVIGHPRGLVQPQFSLQDNEVLDHDDRVVHYRSPTEPGSSGSPVFDDSWHLIALHHSGRADMPRLHGVGGTYEANEGVSVLALKAALAMRPPITG